MIPSVAVTKVDGQTGVVRPGSEGILAIIAPSEKGTVNQPAGYTRGSLALTDFGQGPLVNIASYELDVAKNPVLLIRGTASTAAAYGTVTTTGGGTSVVTAGATAPYDDYDALITFIVGGTVGVAGATYTYSLDGGVTTSAVQALGTANTIAIPGTNVGFALAAGTLLAGETIACPITGPKMTNADLILALEALRTSSSAWDMVLVHGDATATTVSTLDTWLSGLEATGKFKGFIANSRMPTAAETEAAYKTALTTAFSAAASARGLVCAGAADMVSPTLGITQRRYASVGVAARLMQYGIEVDAAYVANGPLPGLIIADTRGNPKHHDEALYPGLDDIRLASLRSFDGTEGVYVNNPLLISASGSDYVYAQHLRCMNKACEIAYQICRSQLSRGVRKNSKTGYILEEDAQGIDALVNAALATALKGRVSAVGFALSRTNDLSSNAGATVDSEIQMSALAYIKRFAVNAKFTRRLTIPAA